ncbi:hypothetical protein M413DRAFT_447530 [Hebeloma cylindrosporum]|uniref:Uncharacterized protein n=1 Tax=Hebeloma cylindrosporum TaxID=76867 RepID=A0A0C3C5E6_HEBCY|nr:hypothetical protein M413DRAFT_447530 [Hebeloma cylindrosporum h7]
MGRYGGGRSVHRRTTPLFLCAGAHGLYLGDYIAHLWFKCVVQLVTIGQGWLGWARVFVQTNVSKSKHSLSPTLIVHT